MDNLFLFLLVVGIGWACMKGLKRNTVVMILFAGSAAASLVLGKMLTGSHMLGLLLFGVAIVAWKAPSQLKDGIGMVLGYLVLMIGLSTLFDWVPSPMWVRILISVAVVAIVVWAGFRYSFRNTPVKAAVLYFCALSAVGTVLFWSCEGNREVVAKRPVTQQTVLSAIGPDGQLTEVRRENHTVTEEYRYVGETFRDSWFTVISACCVTGLIVTDTAAVTIPGQIVMLVMIQAGGLGIIFFTAILGVLITQGGSRRNDLDQLHAATLDVDTQFVGRLVRQIFQITLFCELAGILILGSYFQWIADPAPLKGWNPWYWAAFHSISAFNNAGFGLMSDNLMGFVKDPVVNLTIASLIILGGLGYPVLIRIWVWVRVQLGGKNGRTTSLIADLEVVQASRLQTWVALQGTVLLLKVGTVMPLLLDWNNPTMADLSVSQKVMVAFFQSVSARTAGFNTVDLGMWSVAPLLIYMALMFIGACPQGTGGGIKITTFRLVMAYISNWFRAPYQHVVVQDRSGHDWLVDRDAMVQAMRVFLGSLLTCWFGAFLISCFERDHLVTPDPTFNYLKVSFEVISAFGTVGLSMGYEGGVTSFSGLLTGDSKVVLTLIMLIGRLGVVTLLALVPWRQDFDPSLDAQAAEKKKKFQVG